MQWLKTAVGGVRKEIPFGWSVAGRMTDNVAQRSQEMALLIVLLMG